jgi:phosphate transport system permease protein
MSTTPAVGSTSPSEPQGRPNATASAIRGSAVRPGDRVFGGLTKAAGILVLVIMAAIGIFLIWKAVPALRVNTVNFFTYQEWFPDAQPPQQPAFGIAALAFGTIMTAIIAMILAVPVGYGIALFVAYYAPRRLANPLAFVIDLLAAVPSIIFGLWGLQFLMPNTVGLMQWLTDHLGWIPLFSNDLQVWTRSIAIASIVLAIMILPTVSAISREVFVQAPRGHIEAALALGATRWEMIRTAVIPFGRPGMISAAMLGLGRALGETIAVALVLSASFAINWQITEPGGNTFAANIANRWNEAGTVGLGALIASGLVLFIITLLVNMAARLIIERRREFSGAN